MRKKTRTMLITMILIACALLCLMHVFLLLYRRFEEAWLLSAFITCLTTFYHFAMRLFVGEAVDLLCKDTVFPQDRFGFHLYAFEKKLYRRLNVQKWKAGALTAKPELFDLSCVTAQELLHNVMQAELVHRIIMVLSFVPLLFIIPYGAPFVFILTSVFACLIDLQFVIIQRYNRPRILKYIRLSERRKHT